MVNYIRTVCGSSTASADDFFNDIKANFESVTGWQKSDNDIFICPHDKNAGIKFTKTETVANTTYLIKMNCCTREGEPFEWVESGETSILTYTTGKTDAPIYMTFYVSPSGKSFTLGFSTNKNIIPVQVIAGMCCGEMAMLTSNRVLSHGISLTHSSASDCCNYSAIVDGQLDFYVATMINPILGSQFDELVKIVSTPYTTQIGQLFKSQEGLYRVVQSNNIGILVQRAN